MIKKNNYLLLLFLMIVAFACSTGQSAFNKGNYYDATIKAVKKLRAKPESLKTQELIKKSYPMALEYHQQRIDAFAVSNQPDKFLKIVDEYTLMNKMADEITRCPAALNAVKPVIYYHDQLKKAEMMALNEQYENAKRLLQNGTIEDGRLAYQRLMWVKQRSPNFENIDNQLAIAKDVGTLRVVVEDLPIIHRNYNVDTRGFYIRVFDQLNRSASGEFLRFYQPKLAEELRISPHEIIEIQFVEFNIDALHESIKAQEFTNDSVVVGTYTDNNGDEFPVIGKVKANVEIIQREVRARALLNVVIKDHQSGEIIQSRKYPSDYVWGNSWASFNGDHRALPDNIIALTKEKQRNPPTPQEMFMLVSDPIYTNASSFLKSFYNKR